MSNMKDCDIPVKDSELQLYYYINLSINILGEPLLFIQQGSGWIVPLIFF